MKKLFKFLFAFLFIAVTAVAYATGHIEKTHLAYAVTPVAAPLLNQQAEKEMIKQLRHDNSWLSELKSRNNWVSQDVIKIPKRGLAPAVLINNNVYPIAKSGRDDSHVILSLNKYDTENTVVTKDELYALPYEKVNDVQVQHREELEDKTAQHALHSIAPSENTSTTPILTVTGTADGGRPTLCSKDVVALKKKFDKLNVPKSGRILVLCPEHVGDLLNEDRTFYQRYHNTKAGEVAIEYYGFKIYEANYTPTYTAGVKQGFDAVGGSQVASIAMHKNWAVKATGTVERFMNEASTNAEYRESVIGFRLWFIACAIRDEGVGALVG
jgi:hypothetical protein